MALYVLLAVLIIVLSLAWLFQNGRPRRAGADSAGGDTAAGTGWADSGGDCGDGGGDGGGDGSGCD